MVYRPISQFEALQEANRCLYCYDAPCTKACPTHIDVPAFIRKITTKNLQGSARVIMEANPVGASCARVCPTEQLCEGACVLQKNAVPIRIGDLQRYVTDFARDRDLTLFSPGPSSGKRVAILGGGPAGLSAARELARFGHTVTIYEQKPHLGGLDTYGIVPFRLPVDISLWEVEQVRKLGVEMVTGVRVGQDVDFNHIVNSFDAVVLAVGMGTVPKLNIPGEELEGVWDALALIEQVKSGLFKGSLGEHVVVIGAGNTAIDAATSACRLGVPEVEIYYRRTQREMTAYPSEFNFAKQEGVGFHWLSLPKQILGQGGRVTGIEFLKARFAEDNNGRPVPVPILGSEFVVPTDGVIRAIGQSRVTEFLQSSGIKTEHGVISVNSNGQTSHPKVFAAGDCIFAKGHSEAMVVEAAQQGKIAAASIHRFLSEKNG
ncbi:NAD(P)-dependent oxidoreductase [Alicyclobacillaceae bacterium I2511]|nr:NAD(P)-dependent oxidoreductase [Alicyclobacillaceae bacterium I2511]